MEVIGTLILNDLDGGVNTFDNIAYIFKSWVAVTLIHTPGIN